MTLPPRHLETPIRHMRTSNTARRRRTLRGLGALLLLAGAGAAGCNSLDVTNPNQQDSGNFWTSEANANAGLIAAYNSLEFLGTFGRWQAFANDIRSDIGTARESPWGDLASFNRFQLNDYNFEVNRHLFYHNYELIKRANEVIANVPGIPAGAFHDAATQGRIVGEAKFLRALGYYNLVTLFENVPLVTTPLAPTDRPATATPEETWAQIEKDLTDAAAVLPETYGSSDVGRPTKFAALGILGRARLQQRKWADASNALGQVISSGKYALLANYADNFREQTENQTTNSESLFEVQMEDQYPIGVTGLSYPKMIGPCYRASNNDPFKNYDPTYCDGRPTRWYQQQFANSKTTTGGIDPRMEATLLWNHTSSEQVFGKAYSFYFRDDPSTTVKEDTMIFFRKYGETQINSEQRWDNPINYRVLRYADVLLMQAEALNEQSQTGNAKPLVDQVRARAQKAPVPGGLSQAQMRDTILYERMFELGLESSRWNDLRRQPTATGLGPGLAAHDPDFSNFVVGKSERLPIPTTETNLNPNVRQNPGW